MPYSDDPQVTVSRLSVTCSEAGTDAVVSFDVPLPIPAGAALSESAVRAFYQKVVDALAASPDLYGVAGQLVTEHRATCTPAAGQ